MNFNCELIRFKTLVDGALRIELDIPEMDQSKVLTAINAMRGKALECELFESGYLEDIKELRKKAHLKILEICQIRGIEEDAMKKKIFDKLFPGQERIRQLSKRDVELLIGSIEKSIMQGK